MMIQATSRPGYAAGMLRTASIRQTPAAASANTADTVRISQAARDALAASASSASTNEDGAIEARLAAIRAQGPINRSQEDQAYLFANDKRLAAIAAQGKSPDELSADDLDYMQKATGLVNTMATLSPAEKALYDKAVASGNKAAAAGIGQIALTRMMGHTAGGASGATYDPLDTTITAANIEKYFSHSIVDPSGKAASNFQALIRFLQASPSA